MKDKMMAITRLVFVALISLSMIHCQRSTKESEYLGPGIVPAQSGFKINSFTVTTFGTIFTNAHKNGVFVIANFNQNVSWNLTIKGLSSGAVKAFNGISNKLDSTNNIWHGEAGSAEFFTAEYFKVSLKIDGYDSVYTYTSKFAISPYDYYGQTRNGVKITVVDDMEGSTEFPNSFFGAPYHDTDPNEMATFKSNAHFSNFAGYYDANGLQSTNIQGTSSYYFSGNDFNYNSYVGGTNTNVLTSLLGLIKTTDPNEVYINFYAYGFGTPNTAINVALYELDSSNYYNDNTISTLRTGKKLSGAAYVLNQNNNDVWQIEVPVNWTGWQLVSLRYNQFRKHNTLGDFGNHVMEPQKLGGIALELDSYPALSSKTVSVALDYVTVTEGGTFSVAK